MSYAKGGDLSNYSGDLGAADIAQIQAWQWQVSLIRLSLETQAGIDYSIQQLQVLDGVTQYKSGIIWAYPNLDDPVQVIDSSVQLVEASGKAVDFYFYDIEDTTNLVASASYISWLDAGFAHADALGIILGIYTGSWFWIPYLNNTNMFSQRPLWDSNPSQHSFVSYGGWQAPVITQYQFNAKLPNGNNVDLDEIDTAWLSTLSSGGVIQIGSAIAELNSAESKLNAHIANLQRIDGEIQSEIVLVQDIYTNVDAGKQDISS